MARDTSSIEALRSRLTAVDGQLLELVAERQRLVAEIGRDKRARGQQTRDFRREKEVIEGALEAARRLGLPEDLVENLMRMLIRSSLTTQERERVAAEGRGGGKRALIIGGAGRIGRWFADFLDSQGYAVSIADPAARDLPYPSRADWSDGALEEHLIVVAAPLAVSGTILTALAARRPAGLIFDLGSLKTPLIDGLRALLEAGCRVTSLHPMFGPDTRLLSGRHVILVDVGCPAATREAAALFESTMADRVVMSLEAHDRLMAYVLGLSHALNIAFFTALADSGEDVPHLARLSSTTFDAQLRVSSRVAAENPELYFEIQSLNVHGDEALAALERSVARLVETIRSGDAAAFVAMMERGRRYLASRDSREGESER
jgi:chorismate mutase/prephenate dehydrogenase